MNTSFANAKYGQYDHEGWDEEGLGRWGVKSYYRKEAERIQRKIHPVGETVSEELNLKNTRDVVKSGTHLSQVKRHVLRFIIWKRLNWTSDFDSMTSILFSEIEEERTRARSKQKLNIYKRIENQSKESKKKNQKQNKLITINPKEKKSEKRGLDILRWQLCWRVWCHYFRELKYKTDTQEIIITKFIVQELTWWYLRWYIDAQKLAAITKYLSIRW